MNHLSRKFIRSCSCLGIIFMGLSLLQSQSAEALGASGSDTDGDGIPNVSDNCRLSWNRPQRDLDSDGIGDVCDSDQDGDGVKSGSDCDDRNRQVYPGATEVANNGVDDNCNASDDGLIGAYSTVDTFPANSAHLSGMSNEEAGAALATGDIDADGYPDLIVGAPSNSSAASYSGRVYLIFGSAAGFPSESDFDTAADVKFISLVDTENVGSAVATGDFNNDGFEDILIGGTGSNTDAGAVYLIYGKPRADFSGSYPLSLADATFEGLKADDELGSSITSVTDINGDGIQDFALGAPGQDSNDYDSGSVYVFFGSTTAYSGNVLLTSASVTLHGEAEDVRAGVSLADAGDVNGDGLNDLLIGAPRKSTSTSPGIIYLVYGSASLAATIDLADADISLGGAESGGLFGYSVSTAGDIDADGKADLLIGAPSEFSSDGRVYVVAAYDLPAGNVRLSAADIGISISNTFSTQLFGYAVRNVGDIDGDGDSEIALSGRNSNAVYVFSADTLNRDLTTADASLTISGESHQYLGGALAGPVDVNLDGYGDLVIGAPLDSSEYTRAGSVWIINGAGK